MPLRQSFRHIHYLSNKKNIKMHICLAGNTSAFILAVQKTKHFLLTGRVPSLWQEIHQQTQDWKAVFKNTCLPMQYITIFICPEGLTVHPNKLHCLKKVL